MVNKPFYSSKTFWGVTLLGIEGALQAIGQAYVYPWIDGLLFLVGIILTGYGFRSAMPKK